MPFRKKVSILIAACLLILVGGAWAVIGFSLSGLDRSLAAWYLPGAGENAVKQAWPITRGFLRLLGRHRRICESGLDLAAGFSWRFPGPEEPPPFLTASLRRTTREAIEACETAGDEFSKKRMSILKGHLAFWNGEDRKAEERFLWALDSGSSAIVADAELGLALLHRLGESFEAAARHFSRAMEANRLGSPDQRWKELRARWGLGMALERAGRRREAQGHLRLVFEHIRKNHPEDDPRLAFLYRDMAAFFLRQDAFDEAVKFGAKALGMIQATYGESHSETGQAHRQLALALDRTGREDEALLHHEEALSVFHRALPEGHPDIFRAFQDLGAALQARGLYEKALDVFSRALTLGRASFPKGHPALTGLLMDLAELHLRLGRFDEALAGHNEILAILRGSAEANSPLVGRTLLEFARAYSSRGQKERAVEFAAAAVKAWSAIMPPDHIDLVDARELLDRLRGGETKWTGDKTGGKESFPAAAGGAMEWDANAGIIPSSIYYRYPAFREEQKEQVRQLIKNTLRDAGDLRSLFRGDSVRLDIKKRLSLGEKDVIADIGCGTGGFEVSLLLEKIPFRRLYAVDIDAHSLDVLRFILKESNIPGHEKIRIVQNTYGTVALPEDSIDVMLLLNTPLYLKRGELPEGEPDPMVMSTLSSMHAALKEGGRLHVFDRDEVFENVGDPFSLMISPFEAAGFRVVHRERMSIANPHHYVVFMRDVAAEPG